LSLKAIIFDHDGTLVDSEGIHFGLWRSILADYGIDFSQQTYRDHHYGVPTMTNAETLITRHRLNVSAETLFNRKRQGLIDWLSRQPFPLLPNVREALDLCRAHHLKIGLATGAGNLETQTSLREHQLEDYFDAIATKDDVAISKPAPDVYQLALRKLAVQAKDAVAIEDSVTGLTSAQSAGLQCIAVKYKYACPQNMSTANGHAEDLLEAVEAALRLLTVSSPRP